MTTVFHPSTCVRELISTPWLSSEKSLIVQFPPSTGFPVQQPYEGHREDGDFVLRRLQELCGRHVSIERDLGTDGRHRERCRTRRHSAKLRQGICAHRSGALPRRNSYRGASWRNEMLVAVLDRLASRSKPTALLPGES